MRPCPAGNFPALPYPGARPDYSYLLDEDQVVPLGTHGPMARWSILEPSGPSLDRWLHSNGHAPMSDRVPLLSYGSNACPDKLTQMRHRDGLRGPVVMTSFHSPLLRTN